MDTKENLAYNYSLLETAVENITADYFNAITPILTNAISNGFDQLKEETLQKIQTLPRKNLYILWYVEQNSGFKNVIVKGTST